MQKDIIYIDVDDDITAIIGKVKASREKVVALVPPKRIGVLQSAVNLRLLERAAKQSDKKLAIVSSNPALMSLAAAAGIPVAKNLQSKPELGEIEALDVDDGEDVIDGAELPVGEHARMADTTLEKAAPAATAATAAGLVDDEASKNIEKAPAPALGAVPTKPKTKKAPKIPNFDQFRKRLLLIGGAGVLLIAFLVWAIWFAPRATVVIAAKTTDASLNDSVKLSSGLVTSAAQKSLKSTSQTLQKSVSQTFSATGQKNIGQKATGSVKFTNNTQNDVTVSSGTNLTSNSGAVYVLNSDVTIPGGKVVCNPFPKCHGATNSVSGAVTAQNPGANYNAASGNLSGTPSGVVATFANPTSGGTDQMVKVVTASDIANAKQQLAQNDTDQIKQQLAGQFGSDAIALRDTFAASNAAVTANPGENQQADSGQATLTGNVTYTMAGAAKTEIGSYLDQYFKNELNGQKNQRVYDNGQKGARFANVNVDGDTINAQLIANGKIGPSINDEQVKAATKGKRLGEIQSQLQGIQGVENVDVKYWPFWVSSAPNDTHRINVQFKLSGK